MEQLLLICLGAFIGFLIGGLFSTGKPADMESAEAYIDLLTSKLREEEKNNELLREANQSLMDDYIKLEKGFSNGKT